MEYLVYFKSLKLVEQMSPSSEDIIWAIKNVDPKINRWVMLKTDQGVLRLIYDTSGHRILLTYYEFDNDSKYAKVKCLLDPLAQQEIDNECTSEYEFIPRNGESEFASWSETVDKDYAIEVALYIYAHKSPPADSSWDTFY